MSESITIPLTQGYEAVIDAEDAERVLAHKWHAHKSQPHRVYARGYINGAFVYLHRFIVDAKRGERTDHWNRDTLDCRKSNLRRCTQSQNIANARHPFDNRSGFKGVSPSGRKWDARVGKHRIGLFDDVREAAIAYDQVAREMYGEFALTNADLGLL